MAQPQYPIQNCCPQPCPPPISPPTPILDLLKVPLSISLLITSPLRMNLRLSPVAAFFVPIVESNVLFGALVIAVLNLFISFLMKINLVCPPNTLPPPTPAQVTLTMPQLSQLISAYAQGLPVEQYLHQSQGVGSFGGDEPLFPDNLSVSLMLSAPFASFDGSPDTSINTPLFEIPGLQGGLIIALLILTGRYIIEEGGIACGKVK